MNYIATALNDSTIEALGLMLHSLARLGIILFGLVAVGIMLFACLQALYRFRRHRHHTVIQLRKWMNVALLFILCGEVLRMVTAHSFDDIVIIFCIIVIHAFISLLSHWEMKHSEASDINL